MEPELLPNQHILEDKKQEEKQLWTRLGGHLKVILYNASWDFEGSPGSTAIKLLNIPTNQYSALLLNIQESRKKQKTNKKTNQTNKKKKKQPALNWKQKAALKGRQKDSWS